MKKIFEKIIKFFLIIFVMVISLNGAFLILTHLKIEPVYSLYKEGVIIELPGTGSVYVFAHGFNQVIINSDNNEYTEIKHITTYNKKEVYTLTLIDYYLSKGFDNIWLSQCFTGDYDELYYDSLTNTTIFWSDYPEVSRNTNPGVTKVFFLGFGFLRV